jgi:hypothetical protein
MWIVYEAMNEDSRGVDVVGIKLAGGDNLLYLCDCNLSAGRGQGIEVARGLAIDEVA